MSRMTAALIALVLAACAGTPSETPERTEAHDSHSPVSSESAAPTLQATAEEASEAPAGAVEILLTCCPDFEPKEATAQAGAVVFFLHNDNGDAPPALHNFVIGSDLESPPLAASPTLAQGESIVFTVSGIEAGTYTYWCTVAAPDGTLHSQAGMTGTLTVTE
jgi:plastocyanin